MARTLEERSWRRASHDWTRRRPGPVLVNNAAFWWWEGFLDIPEDHYDQMLDVDLKGPFLAGQHAARSMIEQGSGGSIVNISSTHRHRVWPKDTVYGIAKAGIA